ncbi:AAA family ATPase [bacterium]|nr:AAA family ATPase [bacterium]
MSQRCVILVGPMGSGKTSVGEMLAETLGYQFVDTDKLIEKGAGKKISDIFAQDGQAAFRAQESSVIAGLANAKSKVIATGGGAVLDPQNVHVFRGLGLIVYLRASARELYQRVKNDDSRPLLKVEDPKAEMARIVAERDPLYRDCADVVINTEDLSVEEVNDKLIDELAKRTLGDG